MLPELLFDGIFWVVELLMEWLLESAFADDREGR